MPIPSELIRLLHEQEKDEANAVLWVKEASTERML